MKLKKIQKLKLIIPIIVILIDCIVFIYLLPMNTNPIYQYQISQNTDYKVHIDKNDFIDDNYLQKNQVYLQKLVRYIELNFLYEYNATSPENLSYKYDISATLNINYSNTNQNLITKKDFIIQNKTLQQNNSSQITVRENVNIDYQMYYQEVQKFKEQFGIPVTASLIVTFDLKMQIGEQEEIKNSSSTVTIDLTGNVFDIKTQESEDEQDTILEIEQINKDNNAFTFIQFVILISSLMYVIHQIKIIYFSNVPKIKKQTNTILKKYKQIIVELEKEPIIDSKGIIDVKSFNELVTIEEEIREPILYYEKEEESVFLIIDSYVTYRKIIK